MGMRATTTEDWLYARPIYLEMGDTTTQLMPLAKLIKPNKRQTTIL